MSRRGFTLVELLVAATMLAVLGVGLGAHLRGGVRVWRRVTGGVDTAQRLRVAMGRLEQDLAHAILYDTQDTSFGTDPGKLPPPQWEGAPVRWYAVVRQRGLPHARVEVITYECGQISGVSGLWRTRQSVGAARQQREVVPERLLPDCRDLTLQFAYRPPGQPLDEPGPIEWRAQWPSPTQELPRLVRASLAYAPDAQGGRGSVVPVDRVFTVPAGILKVDAPASP